MAKIEVLTTSLKSAEKTANDTLKVLRKAIGEKDLAKYALGMKTLQKNVQDVNKILCKVEYANFLESENPMIAAVQQFYVTTYKIKEKRDKEDGSIVGVEIDKKKARINLEDFCDFGKLSKEWVNDAAHLLDLLALRETDVFAMSPSDISTKSFYFIRQAKAKQDGKTPDSNTQITKLLQKIIDEMIFVDNGEGLNAYKCTSHDLMFIHDAVTKLDAKEKCTIKTMNERQFQTVLMSVLAHCLGEAYKVKAAKIKNND